MHIFADIKLPKSITFRKRLLKWLPLYIRIKKTMPVIEKMTLDEKVSVARIKAEKDEEIIDEICLTFFDMPASRTREKWKLNILTAHVYKQMGDWAKAESIRLKYTPDADELAAGYEKFEKFGDFNTYDAIALRMHIDYISVGKLKYQTVFTMLWKDLESYMFQKNLVAIKSKPK